MLKKIAYLCRPSDTEIEMTIEFMLVAAMNMATNPV